MNKKQLMKKSSLIDNKGIVRYCKKFLSYAEKPVRQAKALMKKAESDDQLVASKPNLFGDSDTNFHQTDNELALSHDLYVDTNFHVDCGKAFDETQDVRERYDFVHNPTNYVNKKQVITYGKRHIKKDNQIIEPIAKTHKPTANANYKLMLSDDLSSFFNKDEHGEWDTYAPELEDRIDKLSKSKQTFRKKVALAFRDKLELMSCIAQVQNDGNDKTLYQKKPFIGKGMKDGRHSLFSWNDLDDMDSADYKLFVANPKYQKK